MGLGVRVRVGTLQSCGRRWFFQRSRHCLLFLSWFGWKRAEIIAQFRVPSSPTSCLRRSSSSGAHILLSRRLPAAAEAAAEVAAEVAGRGPRSGASRVEAGCAVRR